MLSIKTLSAILVALATFVSADLTPAQVVAAAPGSASCDGTPSCRTADQATPFLNAGFKKYGFNTPAEQAAILSLIAFETADFKFDVNVFPGRPGQGTRNMMMFPFILQYAQETPDVAGQIPPGTTADAPPDVMNAVRALVLRDDLSFESAMWFLKTKCTPDIAAGLQGGSQGAYEAYMTTCIGTTVTPDRIAGFQRAMNAFGNQPAAPAPAPGGGAAPAPAPAPPAPAPPAPAPAPPAPAGGSYTVAPGDFCSAIAEKNGMSVADLLAKNPAINAGCTNLAVGQVLSLRRRSRIMRDFA